MRQLWNDLVIATGPGLLIRGMLIAGLAACGPGLVSAAETLSISTGNKPREGAPIQRQFHLMLDRGEQVAALREGFGLHEWRGDTLRLNGSMSYTSLIDVELRGDFVDLWYLGEETDSVLAETTEPWEDYGGGDTEVNLTSFDDRLHFTLHRAWSRYDTSELFLSSLDGSENRDNRERLWSTGQQQGQGSAMLYRADAVLWDAENSNLSMFAQQSEVDLFFESLAREQDDEGDKDPFAKPNRETVTVGTTVGIGPVQVTLYRDTMRKLESTDEDETVDGKRELSRGTSVSLDLDDLRDRAGELFQGSLWEWAPDSLWFEVSSGQVITQAARDPADPIEDVSFGSSWSWSSGYASAGYWRSVYDSRGAHVDDYDWAGNGTDVALGFYGDNWSVDTSFGLYRSESLAPESRSLDTGLDSSLWVTLKPSTLPDLSGGLSVGRYGNDYLVYDASSRLAYQEAFRSDIWEVGVDLDFSKSLADWKLRAEPTLRMVYRFGAIPRLDASDGASAETDQIVAVLFGFKL
jgi:hypothetical protein